MTTCLPIIIALVVYSSPALEIMFNPILSFYVGNDHVPPSPWVGANKEPFPVVRKPWWTDSTHACWQIAAHKNRQGTPTDLTFWVYRYKTARAPLTSVVITDVITDKTRPVIIGHPVGMSWINQYCANFDSFATSSTGIDVGAEYGYVAENRPWGLTQPLPDVHIDAYTPPK